MTHPRTTPSASPRWPVLGSLVAVVLGAHLVLLAGGVTLNLPGLRADNTAPATSAAGTTEHTPAARTADAPAQSGAAVRVSAVRWIAPTPAPQALAATPNPPAAKPAPPPRAKPVRPPPEAPAQMVKQAVAPPAPEWAVAQVPEVPAETPALQAETAATAHADTPPPPEPAAEPPAAEAQAAGDADDTLLAAAASGKPRTPTSTAKLPPAQPPASTRLQYDVIGQVKGIGYKAEGTLNWTVADGRYDARMDMRVPLLGSRSQTSTGRVGPTGLMPERFADKSRSEKAAHFEAAAQRITFSNNAPEAPLQPGAQDRLSLFLQLAGLLQARPQAYATGQTVDMQVAGTGDAPLWRFEVGAESTLSLPAGEFKVRRLVRQPRKEFDSTVEMWLAPSLGYLPVRLRVTQSNGDVADQQLRQLP